MVTIDKFQLFNILYKKIGHSDNLFQYNKIIIDHK